MSDTLVGIQTNSITGFPFCDAPADPVYAIHEKNVANLRALKPKLCCYSQYSSILANATCVFNATCDFKPERYGFGFNGISDNTSDNICEYVNQIDADISGVNELRNLYYALLNYRDDILAQLRLKDSFRQQTKEVLKVVNAKLGELTCRAISNGCTHILKENCDIVPFWRELANLSMSYEHSCHVVKVFHKRSTQLGLPKLDWKKPIGKSIQSILKHLPWVNELHLGEKPTEQVLDDELMLSDLNADDWLNLLQNMENLSLPGPLWQVLCKYANQATNAKFKRSLAELAKLLAMLNGEQEFLDCNNILVRSRFISILARYVMIHTQDERNDSLDLMYCSLKILPSADFMAAIPGVRTLRIDMNSGRDALLKFPDLSKMKTLKNVKIDFLDVPLATSKLPPQKLLITAERMRHNSAATDVVNVILNGHYFYVKEFDVNIPSSLNSFMRFCFIAQRRSYINSLRLYERADGMPSAITQLIEYCHQDVDGCLNRLRLNENLLPFSPQVCQALETRYPAAYEVYNELLYNELFLERYHLPRYLHTGHKNDTIPTIRDIVEQLQLYASSVKLDPKVWEEFEKTQNDHTALGFRLQLSKVVRALAEKKYGDFKSLFDRVLLPLLQYMQENPAFHAKMYLLGAQFCENCHDAAIMGLIQMHSALLTTKAIDEKLKGAQLGKLGCQLYRLEVVMKHASSVVEQLKKSLNPKIAKDAIDEGIQCQLNFLIKFRNKFDLPIPIENIQFINICVNGVDFDQEARMVTHKINDKKALYQFLCDWDPVSTRVLPLVMKALNQQARARRLRQELLELRNSYFTIQNQDTQISHQEWIKLIGDLRQLYIVWHQPINDIEFDENDGLTLPPTHIEVEAITQRRNALLADQRSWQELANRLRVVDRFGRLAKNYVNMLAISMNFAEAYIYMKNTGNEQSYYTLASLNMQRYNSACAQLKNECSKDIMRSILIPLP